jgi:hypothetical protein
MQQLIKQDIKANVRSVGGEGTEHGGAETLEESLGTLGLQEDAKDISNARVGTSGSRLEARLENIWGNGNSPHGNTSHTY